MKSKNDEGRTPKKGGSSGPPSQPADEGTPQRDQSLFWGVCSKNLPLLGGGEKKKKKLKKNRKKKKKKKKKPPPPPPTPPPPTPPPPPPPPKNLHGDRHIKNWLTPFTCVTTWVTRALGSLQATGRG